MALRSGKEGRLHRQKERDKRWNSVAQEEAWTQPEQMPLFNAMNSLYSWCSCCCGWLSHLSQVTIQVFGCSVSNQTFWASLSLPKILYLNIILPYCNNFSYKYEGKKCQARVQRSPLGISWGEQLATFLPSGAAHSPRGRCITEMTIFYLEKCKILK